MAELEYLEFPLPDPWHTEQGENVEEGQSWDTSVARPCLCIGGIRTRGHSQHVFNCLGSAWLTSEDECPREVTDSVQRCQDESNDRHPDVKVLRQVPVDIFRNVV